MDQLTKEELVQIAKSIIERIEDILSGTLQATDEHLQQWTTQIVVLLSDRGSMNELLQDSMEACLVDIGSCDDMSWDTTPEAFENDLYNLKKVLESVSY